MAVAVGSAWRGGWYINRQNGGMGERHGTAEWGERGELSCEEKAKCVRRWVWVAVAPWPVFVRWSLGGAPGRRRGVFAFWGAGDRYRYRCGGGTDGFPLMGGWRVDP